jgi:hypothetical protein
MAGVGHLLDPGDGFGVRRAVRGAGVEGIEVASAGAGDVVAHGTDIAKRPIDVDDDCAGLHGVLLSTEWIYSLVVVNITCMV